MQSKRYARVRRPGRGQVGSFFVRWTFRKFVWLVLLLAALVVTPQIYLHTRIKESQSKEQDCKWLSQPPLVCAHGGDSAKAPPNTEAAYRLALDSQVDCMEIDVSRTLDGVLVTLHDRDLQAMHGNPAVQVGHFTFSQIKEVNPGQKYSEKFHKQQVLTLEAALQYVAPHVKQVIIDAKAGPPNYEDGMAADIHSVVKNVDCHNCVMWAKADRIVQDYMRLSLDPDSVGYVVMKDKVTGKVSDPLRMKGASIVGAFHGIISTKLAKTVHRAGKKLLAWTVDEEEVMLRLLRTGVDGMVTSVPTVLQWLMGSERQQCAISGFS